MALQGAYSDSRHVWHKSDGWHYLRVSTGTTDRNPGTGENMADSWGPRRLLESCGLRMVGSCLANPLQAPTRKCTGDDDDLAAVVYCQTTEGWHLVREVVIHVFGNGQPVESFRWQQIGCGPTGSLLRRGWGAHIGHPRNAARLELEAFETRLSERMRHEPFIPPSKLKKQIKDESAQAVADQVSGEVDARYGT